MEVKDNMGEKFHAKSQRKNTKTQRLFAPLLEIKSRIVLLDVQVSDTRDDEKNYLNWLQKLKPIPVLIDQLLDLKNSEVHVSRST